MNKRMDELNERLVGVISAWEGIRAVAMAPAHAEESEDPYFTLSLDVYYTPSVPPSDHRRAVFEGAGAFESRLGALKDRFFLEGVPVRIEYKKTDRIDQILQFSPEVVWDHRRAGTYGLYRILYGTILYSDGAWIEGARKALANVPDHFWSALKENWQATMEHALIDMKASSAREDDFFFLQSLAVFLKTFASLLFVVNRRFEPSARLLPDKMRELPSLPEHFSSYLDSLMSWDPDLPKRRKCDIAEILAQSILQTHIIQE